MIQEYIKEKYGLNVQTVNITEMKRILGLLMHDATNKVDELKNHMFPLYFKKRKQLKKH